MLTSNLVEEELRDVGIGVLECEMQRRLTSAVAAVDVGLPPQEQFGHRSMPVGRCRTQRRHLRGGGRMREEKRRAEGAAKREKAEAEVTL